MINTIEFKNITKKFSSNPFLLKIGSLKLCNENINVIVGTNGCGKSTLLNLIAGVDIPDKGSISFANNGCCISKNELRGKRGFLTQGHYLFNMSVSENVALGLKIRKREKNEITSKVSEMLKILKINQLANRSIANLSGGERQRTAIAQTLVLEPQIILMDEPTANIDARNVFFIEELIKDMHKKYKPLVIITTHSFSQAYRISSDIISMSGGKIVDFTHENVFSGPAKEEEDGLKYMRIAGDKKIVFSEEKITAACMREDLHIAIDPDNIILSKNMVSSSARNHFKGRVSKIESCGSNVRLLIDIGAPLYAVITKQSFAELGINLGMTIYASFKVNSVRVLSMA
ncbi:MAG: ABC transporter ATP-binding protein [Candidatus Omnitrophota bacterium]